ncbi:MAG: tRNA-dihydrouridine synthase family protein [Pseudomonadota bacterium]
MLLAPMLGITDVTFRNVFAKHFSGFDFSYAPFIKVNQNLDFKKSKMAELSPSLNRHMEVIPQIMCNDIAPFLHVSSILADLGYRQVNLNLGCPSPTSSGRGLGCGLMPDLERVDRLLNGVFERCPLKVSIKTRLGLNSSEDISNLIPIFNRYPLDHVVIHPRTGKQGYSGEVDLEGFKKASQQLKTVVCYSGDIKTFQDFQSLRLKIPEVSHFLIGRGALRNPNIFKSIQTSSEVPLSTKDFSSFILELADQYLEKDISLKDVLIRVKTICYYFASSHSFPAKQIKAIRKSRSMLEVVQSIAAVP